MTLFTYFRRNLFHQNCYYAELLGFFTFSIIRSKNQVIMCVIHHRQVSLECKIATSLEYLLNPFLYFPLEILSSPMIGTHFSQFFACPSLLTFSSTESFSAFCIYLYLGFYFLSCFRKPCLTFRAPV
jgi:hypothetical protein